MSYRALDPLLRPVVEGGNGSRLVKIQAIEIHFTLENSSLKGPKYPNTPKHSNPMIPWTPPKCVSKIVHSAFILMKLFRHFVSELCTCMPDTFRESHSIFMTDVGLFLSRRFFSLSRVRHFLCVLNTVKRSAPY